MTTNAISQVVVTVHGSLEALRLANTPGGLRHPLAIATDAVGVVVGGLTTTVESAIAVVLGLDVLALRLIVAALALVVGEDGNVLPWGRVPVGVVVTFLAALKAVDCATTVLAGGLSTSPVVHVPISHVEALVARTGSTCLAVAGGLVHAEGVGAIIVLLVGVAAVDGAGGSPISDDLIEV